MSLEKLDEIIKGMEETTENFKRYKEVYGELDNLQNKIIASNKESLDGLRDLNTSIKNLKNKVEKLNNMVSEKMLEQAKRLLFVIIIAIITFIMNFVAIYPH